MHQLTEHSSVVQLCSGRPRLRLPLLKTAATSRGKFHSVIPLKAPRFTFGELTFAAIFFSGRIMTPLTAGHPRLVFACGKAARSCDVSHYLLGFEPYLSLGA